MRRQFIAGNWKMYKTTAEAVDFAHKFGELLPADEFGVDVAICAPFTQLAALKDAFFAERVRIGAQNMHFEAEGAFTGEISAAMLKELDIDLSVLGHSERRQFFGETDESVNKKLKTAFANGITPILCVGESLEERDAGRELDIVGGQVKADLEGLSAAQVASLVIAYEPVWAIGTGRTASAEQAQDMCAFIRSTVRELYDETTANALIVQYGGSVKPGNAAEILGMPDIDGALVGGASLVPQDFYEIVAAAPIK